MIAQTDAAQAINYLYAAQAITVTDDQAAVWADYLNAELPDAQQGELLPAARRCLKDWAANQRQWKVDLPRFVETVRKIRRERVRAETQARGQLIPAEPLPVGEELEWKQQAIKQIGMGASRLQAEKTAWAAIGRTPPPPEITEKHETPTIGKRI